MAYKVSEVSGVALISSSPAGASSLVARIELARADLASLFSRCDRAYLAFSGGKESIALARLCEPFAAKLSLVWGNTGFHFPHVEAAIRAYGARFNLVELRTDLVANWKAHGLPSDVVPIPNAMPDGFHAEPKLQAWPMCCTTLRMAPIVEFVSSRTGRVALIHGQRFEDRSPGLGLSRHPWPAHVETVAPLADWTTDEVFAFLDAEGIELPVHYAEIRDSLDCWICPAAYGVENGAERAAYMARRHPNLLATVLPGVRRTRDALAASMARMDRSLAVASGDDEPAPVVQFAPDAGDCVIAALATLLRRSYRETATLLGYACDPQSGRPQGMGPEGVSLIEIGLRLLPIGVAATVILSERLAEMPRAGLDRNAMLAAIAGRPAVILTEVEHDGRREKHALAWTGRTLLDCRGPTARQLDVEAVEIHAAAILSFDAAPVGSAPQPRTS